MRKAAFHVEAFTQFTDWAKSRTVRPLIPFGGIGEPELLKHDLKGYWWRRIAVEHRLVYKVTPI